MFAPVLLAVGWTEHPKGVEIQNKMFSLWIIYSSLLLLLLVCFKFVCSFGVFFELTTMTKITIFLNSTYILTWIRLNWFEHSVNGNLIGIIFGNTRYFLSTKKEEGNRTDLQHVDSHTHTNSDSCYNVLSFSHYSFASRAARFEIEMYSNPLNYCVKTVLLVLSVLEPSPT